MDNFPGLGPGLFYVPMEFDALLHENTGRVSNISEMDYFTRDEYLKSSHEFQSKEELERYLYHLHQDDE